MTKVRTKYKNIYTTADHTPREIVDQCILRWGVCVLELEDGLEHEVAEVQGERNAEIAGLKQQIEAGETIIVEFDLNHVQ